jgi:hypothetical protein
MNDSPPEQVLELARVLLCTLEDLVDRDGWSLDAAGLVQWRTQPWAGADIVICSDEPMDNSRGDTFVATPYTGELSWLIEEIKQVCGDFLDFRNKYAFYGRLADATTRPVCVRCGTPRISVSQCFVRHPGSWTRSGEEV